jgi:16S rRNA (guanine966-N2)-methyltransferase
MSVDNYISNAFDKFNIVFYDPPFDFEDSKVAQEILTLESLLEKNGYIVCHRHIKSVTEILSKNLEINKEKNYGQSRILLIKKI